MNIKHKDLEFPEKDPFRHCKLNRQQYALVLTNIVKTYADGFVLAINNEWGRGKTTFVKMWQQQMIDEGFQTLYFNAWENDFEPNPLIALIAELKNLIKSNNKEEFKSLLQKGAVISKSILPKLLKALAARYIDTEVLLNAIEDATTGATEILNDEIKEYASKKDGLKEFRESLSKFVEATKDDKPIVFIIDELDRCRPNYAVELLEQVKHFFSVPGIVFVISIDKVQLGHAVRGVYGNDRIDADEYLRRFIDLEYSIPQPTITDYTSYLFDYFEIDKILKGLNNRSDADLLLKTAELLFTRSSSTLRQQEKMFAQVRIILQTFKPNYKILPDILFILIFIKSMKYELYRKIENGLITLQELSDEFAKLIPLDNEDYHNINIVQVEATLLFLYNIQNRHCQDNSEHHEEDYYRYLNPNIKSKLERGVGDKNLLKNYFEQLAKDPFYRQINLNYLLTKINLLEPIQTL